MYALPEHFAVKTASDIGGGTWGVTKGGRKKPFIQNPSVKGAGGYPKSVNLFPLIKSVNS